MASQDEVLARVTTEPAGTREIGRRLYGREPTRGEVIKLGYPLRGLAARGDIARQADPSNPSWFVWFRPPVARKAWGSS